MTSALGFNPECFSEIRIGRSEVLLYMAKEHQYTHFIAIDFGTAGCGIATSLNRCEDIHAFTQWNPGRVSVKGPTIMLLDHNLECEAFGLMARDRYHRKAVKHRDRLKDYHLFEYFKMSLYEEKVSKNL